MPVVRNRKKNIQGWPFVKKWIKNCSDKQLYRLVEWAIIEGEKRGLGPYWTE